MEIDVSRVLNCFNVVLNLKRYIPMMLGHCRGVSKLGRTIDLSLNVKFY